MNKLIISISICLFVNPAFTFNWENVKNIIESNSEKLHYNYSLKNDQEFLLSLIINFKNAFQSNKDLYEKLFQRFQYFKEMEIFISQDGFITYFFAGTFFHLKHESFYGFFTEGFKIKTNFSLDAIITLPSIINFEVLSDNEKNILNRKTIERINRDSFKEHMEIIKKNYKEDEYINETFQELDYTLYENNTTNN